MPVKSLSVRHLVYCALFAALMAVLAQVSVPIGPVPISLATLGVMLCGLLLGWKYGLMAVAVYLLLGLAGAPVFAGLQGGAARLLGPTGGYLIGYLPYAALAGWRGKEEKQAFLATCGKLLLGTAVCYVLGTAWFMHQSGRAIGDSLTLCVLPFLPGDGVKIAVCALLHPRLKQALKGLA